MSIEILDESGAVINAIVADAAFAEQHFPGRWRAVVPAPGPIRSKRPLSKKEFISKCIKIGKAQPAQLLAMRKSPVHEFTWWEFDLTNTFSVDGEETAKLLDAMQAANVLSASDIEDIKASWDE